MNDREFFERAEVLRHFLLGASPLRQPFHVCPECDAYIDSEPKRHDNDDGTVSLFCPSCEYQFARWPKEDA